MSIKQIQPPVRFSETLLWTWQKEYYNKLGLEAWREGNVPQYITNNPFLAEKYALLALCYWEEMNDLNKEQPLYLIEFAAGSGRFAHLFLQKFIPLYQNSPLKEIPFRYVMSDFTPTLIEQWQRQPQLQQWIKAGILDFALIDATEFNHPAEISLLQTGEILRPAIGMNPIVGVGNYFFDSIPQDLFYILNEHLFEMQVSLTVDETAEIEQEKPDQWLAKINPVYAPELAPNPYYELDYLNQILHSYIDHLENDFFSYPAIGMRCTAALAELAGGKLLFLSGDKGDLSIDLLRGQNLPDIIRHGSISMKVNFHALGEQAKQNGGAILQMNRNNTLFQLIGLVWGDHSPQLQKSYDRQVNQLSSEEFFHLRTQMEIAYENWEITPLLAFLHWGAGDTFIFIKAIPRLLELLSTITETQKNELAELITQVGANYYHMDDQPDFLFHLGILLFQIGRYDESITYFTQSLLFDGVGTVCYYNLAAAHYQLGNFPDALRHLQFGLEINPEHQPSLKLQKSLTKKITNP